MAPPIRRVLRGAARPKTCTHRACSEPHYASGLCRLHYHRRYKGRDMDNARRYAERVPGLSLKGTPQGYVQVWAPDHPRAMGAGYVFQHRYVMEQHLGRYLVEGESVHHLNGDRSDNRLENLELWSRVQPSGQRVEDKIAFARMILGLYGDDDERGRYGR